MRRALLPNVGGNYVAGSISSCRRDEHVEERMDDGTKACVGADR